MQYFYNEGTRSGLEEACNRQPFWEDELKSLSCVIRGTDKRTFYTPTSTKCPDHFISLLINRMQTAHIQPPMHNKRNSLLSGRVFWSVTTLEDEGLTGIETRHRSITQNHFTCDSLKTHAHRQGSSETGMAGTWITIPWCFSPLRFDPRVHLRSFFVPNILTSVLLVGVGSPSTSLPDRGHFSAMANTWLSLDVYL